MRRTLSLLVLCFSPLLALVAQERKIQNKPFIDERRFHYGFFVGVHDQSLRLENNGYTDPSTGQQWVASTDQTNFGFSVGVLGEWKLHKHLALRATPSLHFGSKHITFRELGTGQVPAPRFNNFRPYVLAGISPMYDLTTGKHSKIKAKPFTLMLEAGMGCDLYMPFFKFIPEIKFCFGLTNVLQKKRTDLTDPTQLIYTQSLERAVPGMVVLTFYFE